MIHFKDNKNKSALSTRWAQMSKQEQIIEKKKIEIQAKAEAQKQAAALAAQAKLANPGKKTVQGSSNIFSNDGSFLNQYKTLLEKQRRAEVAQQQNEKQKALEEELKNAPKKEPKEKKHEAPKREDFYRDTLDHYENYHEDRQPKKHRDGMRRWNDRGRMRGNSPMTSSHEDRRNVKDNPHIPSLMHMSIRPPDDDSGHSNDCNKWDNRDSNDGKFERMSMRGPSSKGPNSMNLSSMRSGSRNSGPMGSSSNMASNMGPGANMGSGQNMSYNMGPGPNMGLGPNMGPGQNMGSNSNMGSNMPPLPPPPGISGPPCPPAPPGPPGMPSFMGGPNFPMPPHFMGPNGPGSMMPNMSGPNGPMPPFFGPPFPNNPAMMGPNGPNSMPFMGPSPPFGPNGPNFGNSNGPSFMTSGGPPPLPESKPLLDAPPLPPPKDESSNSPQVLSTDDLPPAVLRAADEVARNGDHWENVLKAVQDQNLWFLHNTNSFEYKRYREIVKQLQKTNEANKKDIKPEDKYDPEFSLEEDDDNDYKPPVSQAVENYQKNKVIKREASSSQSDEDAEKERRRRKKSRWGDDPPVDIKPPGVFAPPCVPGMSPLPMPPLPPMPGPTLSKIDGDGLKLTTVTRTNPALLQYAITNYGTTNLNPEDWKKCEDNFKLNLLYQDMLKKRQEVERMANAGKNKYEYDSDEDTTDGTWEHRLRLKEMSATERWASELTKQAAGKHHIGDFLPPEELKKFMEKYTAVKQGKEPDLSDYKEYKLKEDNVGFKMLQKLGWTEGKGLGAEGTGIVNPINKANQPVANMGLGAASADAVGAEDDEFDAYRKRMMLAYRFRPNPLNNPRRPYY